MFNFWRQKSKQNDELSRILPRIKHTNFLKAMLPMLEQLKQRGGDPEAQSPIAYQLAGDLLIAYAIDLHDSFQFINRAMLKSMNIDDETLHQTALKNLSRKFNNGIGEQDLILYSAVITGENLEATTILIDRFWQQIAPEFPGKLCVAVPSRDVVLFTSDERSVVVDGVEVAAKDCLSIMCDAAISMKAEETNHSLSDYLFTVHNGVWSVLGPLAQYVKE